MHFKNLISINNGFRCFKFGILLLPSAPFFSLILFLISTINGTIKREDNFFKDKFNYPFILITIFMILSTLNIIIMPIDNSIESWDKNLHFLSLINWLPFFYFFWASKKYLDSTEKRKICTKYYVYGSIPVLVGGIAQYFFKLYGPFSFFNGLVVWFQNPICTIERTNFCEPGLTSFFNNPNVTGNYLTFVLPFAIALLITNYKNNSKKKYLYSFIILIIVCSVVLTSSRNAWISMFLIFIIFSNKLFLILFSFLLLILFIPFVLNEFSLIPSNVNNISDKLIPINIKKKFSTISVEAILSSERLKISQKALNLIKIKPLLGWGGASFPIIYQLTNGNYIGHTHNLYLELAYNYGLPVAFIISIYFLWLLQKSNIITNKIYKNNLFDKAYYVCFLAISFTNLFDINYYDMRVSFSTWILIIGLRGIIDQESNN